MVESGEKWGINMFIGEHRHTIDEKGRLIIPSKFRDGLGEKFIITRGIENCLYVYSLEAWGQITNKLETLPFTKKDARQFVRFFLSGATTADFDKQGRVNITIPLIEHAHLQKDCVIVGVGSRLEIWAKEEWDQFFESASLNMSDIAENLFDESVNI